MPTASVLLVDDDTFTRTALAGALSGAGYQVHPIATAAQALSFSQTNPIDIALLDLDLGPGPNGIDLAYLLRRTNSNLGLIFLTSYSDPRLLTSADIELPVGSRYLMKSKLSELALLITLIYQTTAYPLRTSHKAPVAEVKLNRNQIEVLKLVATGCSTNQIAESLNLSVKSVEAAISRINHNLGISDTDQNKRVKLANMYYQLIGKLQ